MAVVPIERAPRGALAVLEAAVDEWCAQADPALLTGASAATTAERLAVVNRRLSAKQASMAARAADANAYAARARSAEDWLARHNGTSRSEAKRAIDTARRMAECPLAAEAFDRGELSIAEADAVSSAALVDPGAERSLLGAATSTHDLGKVREQADRVKRAARSAEDEAARLARLRAGRSWREFTTADGHRAVDAKFVPDDWAKVLPIIDAFTEAQFTAARTAGRRDRHDAYRNDGVLAAFAAAGAYIGLTPPTVTPAGSPAAPATVALRPFDHDPTTPTSTATTPTNVPVAIPDRVRWNVCVIVDAIALKRGYAAPGEMCDIPGIGPISVERARELMDDAIVDILIHDTVDIRAYASATRHKPRPCLLYTSDAADE